MRLLFASRAGKAALFPEGHYRHGPDRCQEQRKLFLLDTF